MKRYSLRGHFAVWFLMLLVSCGAQTEKLSEGHEDSSQTAPDGLSRAFVWMPTLGGLGATVSQPYQVWMQNLHGEKQLSLILEADKSDGIRISWKSSNVLEICYGQAQITRFHNNFVVAEQSLPQIYKAEIILRKVMKLGDC